MSVPTKANSLMSTLRALLRVAPRLQKGYVVFAILNVLYKIIRLIRIRSLQKAGVAGLPGYDVDTTAKAMRANLHRLNDWRAVSPRPFCIAAHQDMFTISIKFIERGEAMHVLPSLSRTFYFYFFISR